MFHHVHIIYSATLIYKIRDRGDETSMAHKNNYFYTLMINLIKRGLLVQMDDAGQSPNVTTATARILSTDVCFSEAGEGEEVKEKEEEGMWMKGIHPS